MIPYLEILDQNLRKFALVEPQECWFELSYYETGEFEVYCKATEENLTALKKGYFVMIPHKRFIWFITSIEYTFTAGGARMISAKGFEAKWLLFKRIIYTPIELNGTITSAIYKLVNNNLGAGAATERQIYGFTTKNDELLIDITGTQAPRGNLGEFINSLLKNYNCGSQVIYENEKLIYKILNGEVKTGNVKFSQSYDNLLESTYNTSDEEVITSALVVSTVEEVEYTQIYDTGPTGIERSELLINSNLATKYEDTNGEEKELDLSNTSHLATYQGWQVEEAKNELVNYKTIEEVDGELDLFNSMYEFDVDYFIGDIVRVQDEHFNYSYFPRILKYTFKQDANGYGEEAEYGGL